MFKFEWVWNSVSKGNSHTHENYFVQNLHKNVVKFCKIRFKFDQNLFRIQLISSRYFQKFELWVPSLFFPKIVNPFYCVLVYLALAWVPLECWCFMHSYRRAGNTNLWAKSSWYTLNWISTYEWLATWFFFWTNQHRGVSIPLNIVGKKQYLQI